MADLQPMFHIDAQRTHGVIVWHVRCARCSWNDPDAGTDLERAKGYAAGHVQAMHAPPGTRLGPLVRAARLPEARPGGGDVRGGTHAPE